MQIGLIGVGAIAEFSLKELDENDFYNLKINSIFARNYERYAHLEEDYPLKPYSGAFGHANVTIKNNPLPVNPKTSCLAKMNILGTLKRMNHEVQVG